MYQEGLPSACASKEENSERVSVQLLYACLGSSRECADAIVPSERPAADVSSPNLCMSVQ